MNSENPYLRLKSYSETDAQYFKGRESESGEIFDLLQRNDVVVLYSESAEGKSSILAAGLYPRLRRHNFLPVSIVFTEDEFAEKSPDFDAIVLGRIRQAMAEANPGGQEPMAPDFARKVNESECFEWVSTSDVELPQDSESAAALTGSAWWMLRDFAIERYGVRVCPVLVFDQFEEVFTRAASAWTDAFFGWLERLFSDNVPEAVGNALDAFPEDEEPEFSTRKDFRTIVSMRNEYMGELDYWGVQRHFLPEFKNSRYCLRALTLDEAEEVLDLRFADRPELKKSVLAALSGVPASKLAEAQRELPMVPAMLLSVVCGVLCEEKSAQKYLDNLKDGNSTAVDNILWDFYRTSMRECRIGPTMRKYLEDVLVDKGGKRVRTKVDSKALHRIGFRDKILPQLKKKGLVKTSRINGEDYVELVHDRLAAIIEKSRTRRSSSKQRVATMFIVILACLIMLFLGTRQQLYSDTLEGRPFAQLNSRGAIEITVDNGANTLESNINVRNATVLVNNQNYYIDVNIIRCPKLTNLRIVQDSTSRKLNLHIKDCPSLQNVYLEGDSLLSFKLSDSYNNGDFFKLHLNPALRHFETNMHWSDFANMGIIPSEEPNDSGFVNFEKIDGVLFNNCEKSIDYISKKTYEYLNLSRPTYVAFPERLKSIDFLTYNRYEIHNLAKIERPDSLVLEFNEDSTVLVRCQSSLYSGKVNLTPFHHLKRIGESAFSDCNFSSIAFPSHLKEINYRAFENCKNLQSIELPDSLRIFDLTAIYGCSKLERLKINTHTSISCSIGNLPFLQLSEIEISDLPGIGSDSLYLYNGVLFAKNGEPVLLTTSYRQSRELADKLGCKYIDNKLFTQKTIDPSTYIRMTDFLDSDADYFEQQNGVLCIPISPSGIIWECDSMGNKKNATMSDRVFFNNYLNRGSEIYIDPRISRSDIHFALNPDSIRTIHLPFGEPYRIENNNIKRVRKIDLTQEQMMNTILYVPYGCVDNYNIPEYKWFQEIREDSWMERYIAPLRVHFNKYTFWMPVLLIAIISFLAALSVYSILYPKKTPERIKIVYKKSIKWWACNIISIILTYISAFYLATNYGKSLEDASEISYYSGLGAAVIIICGPLLLRFVSRIFNRYVIDPLALLFH